MPTIDIPLAAASNLRDLGGWPTTDGRRVRMGLVYRAAALAGLSREDEAVVAALGLRSVCDLRGVRESAHRPVSIEGAERVPLAIEPSVGAGLRDILLTGQVSGHASPADIMALLREAYRDYALENAAQYGGLFARILHAEGLPLLLHCSAGKDRTGFGSALLLTALGVRWDDVMEDYLATNRFWRREIGGDFAIPAPIKDVLLGAHEELLVAAFDAVRAAYGSVDVYLARAIGLDDAARDTLKALMLSDKGALF